MTLQLYTLNESGKINAIFVDMAEAFDTVPINRLCTKLNHYYGIWKYIRMD